MLAGVFRGHESVQLGVESPEKKGQASRSRGSAVVGSGSPSEEGAASSHFTVKHTPFITQVFHLCVPPNQAPEPTTMAVTPRAHS